MQGGGKPVELQASRWFSRLLATIIILTFVCLALMVVLGIAIPDPTETQKSLMDTVSKAFTACLGALFGVIGGKLA
jgi:uncharacterized membrane protein